MGSCEGQTELVTDFTDFVSDIIGLMRDIIGLWKARQPENDPDQKDAR